MILVVRIFQNAISLILMMTGIISRKSDNPHFAVLELSTKAVKLLYAYNEQEIMSSSTFDFNNFSRNGNKTETGKGLDDQNQMNMDYFRNCVLPVIQTMKRNMRKEHIGLL